MSDEYPNNGLSGWEGITLGRMWAEHDRTMEKAGRWFANRRNPTARLADFQAANQAFAVQNQALVAQNQALAAENQRLKQDLSDYKLNYNNLKAWAGRAKARIEELKSGRS